ncbi:MAG: cyclopropane fatty acyl phospholipid synthase [Candidatus Vecturithrix sp.]|jgi:cyclopropane-fatty-acyl-phospholipid synthase|nr:cyclopropane fatty acyl phospholipid synthase [Candidatus Vecturithrix sp.]
MDAKEIISELASEADIHLNGDNPWDIQIHDEQFYQRVMEDGELGFGESYMDGLWDCEALDECLYRITGAKLEQKLRKNWKMFWYAARAHVLNRQKKSRAPQVAQQHYDLGNDLYRAMLDARLNYTCGYWKHAATLDQAQEAKLELVCQKINLRSGMTVLELGCGWGSFAKYAAEKYGAHVTALNISTEQVRLARELCAGLPVEIRQQDYREAEGTYDAVVSIGILEHVGYKNYRMYMAVVERCLKEDGIAFIHTIGGNTSKISANQWIDTYIFPNGMLPSIAQIGEAMENLFVMEDWHNFGPDYDTTLMAWYRNFKQAWPQLQAKYDERFYRIWRFYLLSCAGAFRSRSQQLW